MEPTAVVPVKKPWQSKINIVNAIFGVLAAISLFAPDSAHDLTAFLKNNSPIIDSIWAGINVILRTFFTSAKIELGD